MELERTDVTTDPYGEFRQAVDGPEESLDLGRAALTIARAEYPDLDIAGCLARLDGLAGEVAGELGAGESGAQRTIAALNYVLFRKNGFRGNREDYFNVKNSFLNDVLERRTGIPISLSVLYMEVAQRVGMRLAGVGFPGHFLVKFVDSEREIIIDPFNGGDIKSIDSLQQLLFNLYGKAVALDPELLRPVTKRQILRRMLNNLKVIHLRQRDLLKALAALDRMTIAEPHRPEDHRDRGQVYLSLDCYPQAVADFQQYLKLQPDAPDAEQIRDHLVDLAGREVKIH